MSATLASVLVKDLPARVGLTGSELGSIHAEGDPVEGFVAKLIKGMHETEPGHFRSLKSRSGLMTSSPKRSG